VADATGNDVPPSGLFANFKIHTGHNGLKQVWADATGSDVSPSGFVH
jgi:hypothetical protein